MNIKNQIGCFAMDNKKDELIKIINQRKNTINNFANVKENKSRNNTTLIHSTDLISKENVNKFKSPLNEKTITKISPSKTFQNKASKSKNIYTKNIKDKEEKIKKISSSKEKSLTKPIFNKELYLSNNNDVNKVSKELKVKVLNTANNSKFNKNQTFLNHINYNFKNTADNISSYIEVKNSSNFIKILNNTEKNHTNKVSNSPINLKNYSKKGRITPKLLSPINDQIKLVKDNEKLNCKKNILEKKDSKVAKENSFFSNSSADTKISSKTAKNKILLKENINSSSSNNNSNKFKEYIDNMMHQPPKTCKNSSKKPPIPKKVKDSSLKNNSSSLKKDNFEVQYERKNVSQFEYTIDESIETIKENEFNYNNFNLNPSHYISTDESKNKNVFVKKRPQIIKKEIKTIDSNNEATNLSDSIITFSKQTLHHTIESREFIESLKNNNFNLLQSIDQDESPYESMMKTLENFESNKVNIIENTKIYEKSKNIKGYTNKNKLNKHNEDKNNTNLEDKSSKNKDSKLYESYNINIDNLSSYKNSGDFGHLKPENFNPEIQFTFKKNK